MTECEAVLEDKPLVTEEPPAVAATDSTVDVEPAEIEPDDEKFDWQKAALSSAAAFVLVLFVGAFCLGDGKPETLPLMAAPVRASAENEMRCAAAFDLAAGNPADKEDDGSDDEPIPNFADSPTDPAPDAPRTKPVRAEVVETPAPAGAKPASPVAALKQQFLAAKDIPALESARDALQGALESGKLARNDERETVEYLHSITDRLILDSKSAPAKPKAVFHEVQPGDVAVKIAKKYKVTLGNVKRINKLNDKLTVQLGQTLKIVPGDVVFKVNRAALTGTLYIDGIFIRRYPVCVGAGEATPAGRFLIENKVTNPDWWYEGKRTPFGDPGNILGTRWMGFQNSPTAPRSTASIGIHGTTKPESIPGRESKGCIRLLNASVEELFDFMPQGGTVIVE